MVNLSVEEPDALMRARPDLWEPWVGNDPGPPGPMRVTERGIRPAKGPFCARESVAPTGFLALR
jgi:hypothetical protein